jgi:hypothetical protein
MSELKEYEFTIKVKGYGEDADKAWFEACESYCKGLGHHFPKGLKGLDEDGVGVISVVSADALDNNSDLE